MIWVCLTCRDVVKIPIEEVNVVTGPHGIFYHARCVKGRYVDGKFVVLDHTRGRMEACPNGSPTGNLPPAA